MLKVIEKAAIRCTPTPYSKAKGKLNLAYFLERSMNRRNENIMPFSYSLVSVIFSRLPLHCFVVKKRIGMKQFKKFPKTIGIFIYMLSLSLSLLYKQSSSTTHMAQPAKYPFKKPSSKRFKAFRLYFSKKIK